MESYISKLICLPCFIEEKWHYWQVNLCDKDELEILMLRALKLTDAKLPGHMISIPKDSTLVQYNEEQRRNFEDLSLDSIFTLEIKTKINNNYKDNFSKSTSDKPIIIQLLKEIKKGKIKPHPSGLKILKRWEIYLSYTFFIPPTGIRSRRKREHFSFYLTEDGLYMLRGYRYLCTAKMLELLEELENI